MHARADVRIHKRWYEIIYATLSGVLVNGCVLHNGLHEPGYNLWKYNSQCILKAILLFHVT